MRRILRWLPEERPTTELIFDPWLLKGLGLTDEQVKEIRAANWVPDEEEGEGGKSDDKTN